MARRGYQKRAGAHAERERALERSEEVGAAQAARELGIPASTIRAWRSKAKPPAKTATEGKSAEQPPPADPDDIERLERLLRAEQSLAVHGMNESRKALQAGHSMDAQRYATVHGIAQDKAERIEARLERARAARVLIAEAQAKRIAAVLSGMLSSLDVATPECLVLVRDLLGQAAGDGVVKADEALAERARQSIRDQLRKGVRRELEAEREAEEAARTAADQNAELRGLPAPAAPHPDGEAAEAAERDAMAPPVRIIATTREGAQKRAARVRDDASEEIVEGEVVEPEQHPFAIPYEDIDPDNLDDEAEREWQSLRQRHALQPHLAEHEFRLFWEERARRYRDYAAARAPWRPSAHRLDGNRFNHPGLR